MAPRTVPVAAALLLGACAPDTAVTPTLPAEAAAPPARGAMVAAGAQKVGVCHRTGTGFRELSVAAPAWPAHEAHGDYLTTISVDAASPGGDGLVFPRITDALAAVDAVRRANGEKTAGACRITISVAAGTWRGGYISTSSAAERFPLAIVVPDITLQGALALGTDAAGHAQESASDAVTSRLVPDAAAPRGSAVVVVSSDAQGYTGHGTVITGFHWDAGTNTGIAAIGAQRVQGLTIAGNVFAGAFSGALDARGSSARLERNVVRGHAACGWCLAGPGSFVVTGNRLDAGTFAAVFVTPAVERTGFPLGTNPLGLTVPDDVVPIAPAIDATVEGNLITGYTLQPAGLGTAVRVATFSPSPALSARTQTSSVRVHDNTFTQVTFGVIVDANLLAADGPITGRATADVALARNAGTGICRAPLLVAFSRVSQATAPAATYPYLSQSTVRVTSDAAAPLSATWIDHPAGLGNTLLFNGVPVSSGRVVPAPLPPATC